MFRGPLRLLPLCKRLPSSARLAMKKQTPGQGTGQNRCPAFMAGQLDCPEISDGNRNFSLAGSLFFLSKSKPPAEHSFAKRQ